MCSALSLNRKIAPYSVLCLNKIRQSTNNIMSLSFIARTLTPELPTICSFTKLTKTPLFACSCPQAFMLPLPRQRLQHQKPISFFSGRPNTNTMKPLLWTRGFFTNIRLCKLHKRTCWKCGGDTNPQKELFFCECGVVQQPASCATFFELLQIEQSFDIDTSVLSKRFKDTQRQLHPDKYTTKSTEEQKFAAEQSSLLNKSYSTLLRPLDRAIYILELEDITISENDSVSDPDFLMMMMEDFETISEATSPENVVALERNNDLRIQKCVDDLSTAFKNHDLASAKDITIQLRYFSTIQEKIKEFRMKFFE